MPLINFPVLYHVCNVANDDKLDFQTSTFWLFLIAYGISEPRKLCCVVQDAMTEGRKEERKTTNDLNYGKTDLYQTGEGLYIVVP